jgi:hypothetical protein
MCCKPSGKFIEVNPVQPSKAFRLIDVTLSGITMEVKPEQPRKALRLIDFKPIGRVTEVNPKQPSKAPSLIEVTLSGIIYSPVFEAGQNIRYDLSLLNKTPSSTT